MAPSLETPCIDTKQQWSLKRVPTDSSKRHAQKLDDEDPLGHFRDEFIIPSRGGINKKSLREEEEVKGSDTESAIYLCGNSLGLQPRRTVKYVQNYLETWASKAVTGHFTAYEDSLTPAWIDMDDAAAKGMARIVGAKEDEVAVMDTLTGNLHLLMASFYRPTKERYKIIIEEKAFPSDHYAIESQIRHHNLSPSDALVLVSPPDSTSPYLPLSHIYSVISEHASSTAVLLLPGIQYYSGQLFDMEAITTFAQARGVTVGWDLAHAAGNVPLQLHDWNVDFAVWCTYKYINAGAGATGGMFVHQRHGRVNDDDLKPNGARSQTQEPGEQQQQQQRQQQQQSDLSLHPSEPSLNGTSKPSHLPTKSQPEQTPFRHRLAGWWGGDKRTRFNMAPTFIPRPGAAGFQLSNPSALDMTSVLATLSVFGETNMSALRHKSLGLTSYLEELLLLVDLNRWSDKTLSSSSSSSSSSLDGGVVKNGTGVAGHDFTKSDDGHDDTNLPYQIITPRDPAERGAQLSIRLAPGLLDNVMSVLKEQGVIVDERKPDVVRVAPAPLYNSYMDVWRFVEMFGRACAIALRERENERVDGK